MRAGTPFSVAVTDYASSAAEAHSQAQRMPHMDEAAFQAFYQATAPMLWSYIRRASGDAALADDIMQETFFKFLRAELPAMESVQMKAYLYRTANSLLADHWRRVKRERRWSLANWFGGAEPAMHTESGGDAIALFTRLKPQEQSLLWLAYVEGFEHREIAAAMRLRERSVRVLLFRARKKLAGMLTKRGIGSGEER